MGQVLFFPGFVTSLEGPIFNKWQVWVKTKFMEKSPGLSGCSIQFSSVQSLSRVWLFVTPWIAAHQATLSIIPIPPCKANLHLPPCEHQSFGPFLGLKMVSIAVQPFLERTDSRQCPTPAWKEGLGLFGKWILGFWVSKTWSKRSKWEDSKLWMDSFL